jgi:hypothetical protein
MSVNFHKLSERLVAKKQPINIHRTWNPNPPKNPILGDDIPAPDMPARLSLAQCDEDALRMDM